MNTQLKDRTTRYRPLEDADTPQPEARQAKAPEVDAGRRPRVSRWVGAAVAVIVAASTLFGVNALAGDTTPSPSWSGDLTYEPAFDGPGGNSLYMPPAAPVSVEATYVPAFDSPGGNSMRISPLAQTGE
jgi:hypothetical protein